MQSSTYFTKYVSSSSDVFYRMTVLEIWKHLRAIPMVDATFVKLRVFIKNVINIGFTKDVFLKVFQNFHFYIIPVACCF